MAETFLSQLLIDDNRVESEVNSQCCVCLERYGTLKEGGTTECEIRLPCKHTIGSICVWTWLKTENHNTCPQCREVLFPADPDPEHDMMEGVVPSLPVASSEPESSDDEAVDSEDDGDDDDGDDDDGDDEESDSDDTVDELFDEDAETFSDQMIAGCENLFGDEDTSTKALSVADVIAEAVKVADHKMTNGYSLDTIAATTIYIASHFLGCPKSCREVARQVGVEEYLISSVYTNIYDGKEDLVRLFDEHDEGGVLEDLDPFSWPSLVPEITDRQTGDENDWVDE